jgi:CO/xanthine dehydrogenase Mo-binding subunit/aerobic-type carbon monoxide dehydrogenase small subunit (CoxS/CutS family)
MVEPASVVFTVNEQQVTIPLYPGWNLLRALREHLRLTGAKQSCDNDGTCGACMVIMDGVAVPACTIPLADMNGRRVETIEGLMRIGEPHPLQKAFVLKQVMQCGYATPGQIMVAKALLDANPRPTAQEVALALDRVTSRCSAGYRAVEAVLLAAAAQRGEVSLEWDDRVAANHRRALEKATGSMKYTDDLAFPGMLHGRARRSDLPHARIEKLDVSAARSMPGVVAVFTAADVPGRNRYGLLTPDQPVFCDSLVKMVGDALALVVAETPKQAQAALEKIVVSYTPLPVLTDPRAAVMPGAIQLHPAEADFPGRPDNILWEGHLRKGNVEAGFQQADVIVEADYYTPFQEHGYEELECSIGAPEDDGVVVYCGSQGPTFDQEQIAPVLGLPLEKVRVAHMPTGGAFGGKEDVHTQVQAALAAYLLQRPVKVQFSRYESLRAHHKRHAEFMHYKAGVTRDGQVLALEASLYGDTGAYASTGEAVMFRSMTFAGGPYEIPNVKVDSFAVHTNNITCGAFRGFGSPQPAFAAELHMEKMARAIGMDSLAFRIKNALAIGKSTHTGQVITPDVGDGIRQCLEAVQAALARTDLPQPGPDEGVGIGVAGCYKNIGLGSGIPDSAGARISLEHDGTFLLRTGAADIGQGSAEVMLNIAAETLGVDRGLIQIHIGDTRHDPHGGMTTASRQTFLSGNATLQASQNLLAIIRKEVSIEFNIDPSLIAIQGDYLVRSDRAERLLNLSDLAKGHSAELYAEAHYNAPVTRRAPEWAAPVPSQADIDNNRLHFAYSFGAQAAIVTVNEKTGHFKVHKVIAAFDAGRAIHRPGVEGQIHGGVIQGLGFATSERYRLKEGRPLVTTHAEMGLPKTSELPEIEAIIIEEPHPYGPLGAKGMGEMPLTASAPSIVNAIYDAVGVWVNELPVTPEKILAAIKSERLRVARQADHQYYKTEAGNDAIER